MTRKLITGLKQRTHPLVWFVATLCTLIAIAAIVAGIIILAGYMAIHPRMPWISISDAHLDELNYDRTGLLQLQVTIIIQAENDNARAHATFSETSLFLSFQGMEIAKLAGDTFEVEKNQSEYLNYVVESGQIPLNQAQMEAFDRDVKKQVMYFRLRGGTRAQWRVGLLGSFKFWCHLDCELKFRPLNGTYIKSPCTSRAK